MALAATKSSSTAKKSSSTAKKSSKTTTGNGAKPVAAKAIAAPVAAVVAPRSAGTPLAGWGRIADDEWPAPGDSVIASALADAVDVYRTPGEEAGRLRLSKGRSVAGPVHLLALSGDANWVRVAVPVRPNGTTGWVKRSDVRLLRNPFRAVIELATNQLTVTRGDVVVSRVKVGAGTGGTPTPTGLFFLKELVPLPPSGALGPYAFGMSGFSTVLLKFMGGEGVIGLHGTNAPGKLGGDVSHGCVRIDNATVSMLAKTLPLGTPVEIAERASELPAQASRKTSDWLEAAGLGLPSLSPPPVATPPAVPIDATATGTTTPTTGSEPSVATTTTPPSDSATRTSVSTPTSATPASTSTSTSTTVPFNDDPFGATVVAK